MRLHTQLRLRMRLHMHLQEEFQLLSRETSHELDRSSASSEYGPTPNLGSYNLSPYEEKLSHGVLGHCKRSVTDLSPTCT